MPIIVAVIIFVIIVKAVMNIGANSTTTDANKATVGTDAVNVLPAKDAKVSIYMSSSDFGKEITGPTKMFPTDKMVRITSGESEVEIE